jgi:NRPS condensation-like uncharacterized protein
MKSFKTVSIIFISCFILFLILRTIVLNQDEIRKEEVKKRFYKGTILKVEEGGRGAFWLYLTDTTLLLNIFERKIRDYIQVGDSISKEKGTATIKVYRKDKDSIWQEKVFE